MNNELLIQINDKLEAIRKLLIVQNIAFRKEINKIINDEFLTTDKRKQMYKLFNGNNTIGHIAKILGVTHENVRLLVDDLEKLGAIEIIKKKGKTKYPLKII